MKNVETLLHYVDALRVYRAIEALQQFLHDENNFQPHTTREFASRYYGEIADIVEHLTKIMANSESIQKGLPPYWSNTYSERENKYTIGVSVKDLKLLYSFLASAQELLEKTNFEPDDAQRFATQFYSVVHNLYYQLLSCWFQEEDVEIIEEEGIDALLTNFPLKKSAREQPVSQDDSPSPEDIQRNLRPSPQYSSGIRDNHNRGSIGDFLREKISPHSALSVVSAYFTIYAYDALRPQLDKIDNMQFLFGEPRFVQSLDPEKTDKKSFGIEDSGLHLINRLQQKKVASDCARWLKDKVEIRSVTRHGLLHGKMYHIKHRGGVEDAIVGSSNLTIRGLGLGRWSNNIELNLEVDSGRDRRDLRAWFDELWEDSSLVEDVKQNVLNYLEQLYANHSPQFIYFKTLFHIFEKGLSAERTGEAALKRTNILDTQIWKSLFEFQRDGVKGAINKILQHNGCIIADSVGLGKTFEALAIIKYFELLNYRVLVLCPKKLRENWTVYQAHNNSDLNTFMSDRFGYTVLSHTDLSRDEGFSGDINLSTLNWGNYDLVVIDESHNFRNNTKGRRDEEGHLIKKSRYERLMDDIIRSGIKTKVLLLSATPVNNDLKDLRNQLYFLTEGRDNAFLESMDIASLRDTLASAQRTFTEWSKKSGERKTSELLSRLSASVFLLLDSLTIARSRRHIERYYKTAIKELGGFPRRQKPLSIFADIDLRAQFMSYDQLNDEISNYRLSLFNPTQYVLEEYQSLYAERSGSTFTQSDREHYLIGMMKVNFLKRLESSVRAFAITMERTISKIDDLAARLERFIQSQSVDDRVDNDLIRVNDTEDDELEDAFQVGRKLSFQMQHLDVPRWLRDLRQDRQQLQSLFDSARSVGAEDDSKLAELKSLILDKIRRPTKNKLGQANRKVIVFTAFADTAEYLYSVLRDWATKTLDVNIAMVAGGSGKNVTTFGKNDFNHILTNFSPVSKRRDKIPSMPQDGCIDVLVATDCISEGQNLQDCDYLINYDIHWNPVRIIQRFGRIDRIGSINDEVHLVNFWPTPDLNKYIDLKNRVEARMALVDIATTFEDNILSPDELEDLIRGDLKYRDKQLLRLREEVLELEDFSESVTLNEFTLDDFRIELGKFIEANRKVLQDAPLGLYTVVSHKSADSDTVGPGVIFCLRQRGDTSGNEVINPLQPYYLVYVRGNDVRFTFAQPKQILELFRSLCASECEPNEELCAVFDQETKQGENMTEYTDSLKLAVVSIINMFKKRAMLHLQSSRRAVLTDEEMVAGDLGDFELITWLIIK